MRKALYVAATVMALAACKKDIDFDFHETEPVVVIEGRVTGEGMTVVVTRSRPVTDSVHTRCLQHAAVTISTDDDTTTLPYDAATDSYHSETAGTPGKTYTLEVALEGRHYEAKAVMPHPAPIISAGFFWMTVMDQRMLVYELWAEDPYPEERNQYWYRIDRISRHPHFTGKRQTEPYRWGVRDDRGNPPGKIFIDMMCTSEKIMDEDEEDNWKSILYDGDTVTCQLMTIDRTLYDYFAALRAGQRAGANAQSNISGGCQGYFAAGSVTRTDTIVFSRTNVREWTQATHK